MFSIGLTARLSRSLGYEAGLAGRLSGRTIEREARGRITTLALSVFYPTS